MDVTPAWKGALGFRALLLGSVLLLLGTGCRNLEDAWDVYCKQVDCDGGEGDPDGGDGGEEPDPGEEPSSALRVELGDADAAVLGECVDVSVTTPDETPATFRVRPESAPGADKQSGMVFSEPGCRGEPAMHVDVAAGTVERTLSFRAYTDWGFSDGERNARELELRSAEGGGWVEKAEVQIENGAFIFGPGEAPTELPPDPSSPPVIRLSGCTKIAGRLFGLDSGRPVRHAPGELALLAQVTDEAALSLEPDCSAFYTELDMDNGPLPFIPTGHELVLYIVPPEPFPGCDLWFIGIDGAAEGAIRIDDARELCVEP